MGGRRLGRGGEREGREKGREGKGGTCSKVLGRIDAPGGSEELRRPADFPYSPTR